jgi:hypothetical protein
VRSAPQRQDAVLVGGETWYLTREACQREARARSPGSGARSSAGCSTPSPTR